MKKILLLTLATVVIVLVMAAPALAWIDQYPAPPASEQRDEIVWKVGPMSSPTWFRFVGDAYTSIDENVLTVRFVARSHYAFVDTAIYVVDNDLNLVPHNNGGPIPGRFNPPYGRHSSFGYPYVHQVVYQIPLGTDWQLPIKLVAHAQIAHFNACGQVDQIETGWATGCTDRGLWNFGGSKWARYFKIPGGDLVYPPAS